MHNASSTTVRRRVPRALLVPILLGLAALVGCMGDGPTQQAPSSHLRIIQAVPNTQQVNLYVDTLPVLGGIGYRAITGFVRIESGSRRVRLITTNGLTTVLDHTFDVELPRAYTVVSTGLAPGVEAVVAPDTAPIPNAGEIKLRIIQASPAASTVDVYVTDPSALLSASTPVLEDLVFRGNSEYITLPVGRYRIRLTTAGTQTIVLDLNQLFSERSMRTLVVTDAAGGGLPTVGLMAVDY